MDVYKLYRYTNWAVDELSQVGLTGAVRTKSFYQSLSPCRATPATT